MPITRGSFGAKPLNEKDERNKVPWPWFISAGDISRDGKRIILRSYHGKFKIWNLNNDIYIIL